MRVKDAFFFSFFFVKEIQDLPFYLSGIQDLPFYLSGIQDLPFYLSGIQDRNLSGTENSAF